MLTVLLIGCSTSNNVVGNSLIQKRKYTKGYHVSNKTRGFNLDKNTDTVNKSLVEEEQNTSTKIPSGQNVVEGGSVVVEDVNLSGDIVEVGEATVRENTIDSEISEVQEYDKKKNRSRQISVRKEGYGKFFSIDPKNDLEDNEKAILGILLVLLGVSPFGVRLALGKGRDYKINLGIWLTGFIAAIICVALIGYLIVVAELIAVVFLVFFLSLISVTFLLVAFIHGLVVIGKSID